MYMCVYIYIYIYMYTCVYSDLGCSPPTTEVDRGRSRYGCCGFHPSVVLPSVVNSGWAFDAKIDSGLLRGEFHESQSLMLRAANSRVWKRRYA